MQSRRIPTHIEAAVVALASVALILASIVLAPRSNAHSPKGEATCAHIYAEGTSYQASDTNTVSVTLDGTTKSHVFPTDGYEELAVPNDGLPHSWAWAVMTSNPDPAYSDSDSGSITCGTVTPPHHPKAPHARTKVHVSDLCNCWRDKVKMTGDRTKVSISKTHPTRLTWEFVVRGKVAPNGTRYLLPSRIGGHSGWDNLQIYTVRTTNKPCPCRVNHTCKSLHPNPPPHHSCKGKCD